MIDDDLRGVALTPGIASSYALEFLSNNQGPTKKSDITNYALKRHLEIGGLRPKQDPDKVLKKTLRGLIDQNLVRRVAAGIYKLSTSDGVAEQKQDEEIVTQPEMFHGAENLLGEGSGSVYVYYGKSDRKIAELEGRSFWPCKVGMTDGDVSSRIIAQGIKTSMGAYPVVGLVIRTENAKSLEKILHYCLNEADAWIEDAPGSEWFNTSPDAISRWYIAHEASISELTRGASMI